MNSNEPDVPVEVPSRPAEGKVMTVQLRSGPVVTFNHFNATPPTLSTNFVSESDAEPAQEDESQSCQ